MSAIKAWLRGWWVTLTLPRETRRFLARDGFDPSEFLDAPAPPRRGGGGEVTDEEIRVAWREGRLRVELPGFACDGDGSAP